jgi:hypothetical protein
MNMQNSNMVGAVWRAPFGRDACVPMQFEHGLTLAQLCDKMPLPSDFKQVGYVAVDGVIIERETWPMVKAKRGTVVTFQYPIQGGNAGSILGIVAAIALTFVTAGIGAGGAGGILGSSFAAGTIGAARLAGAVGIAGALAIAALTKPPAVQPTAQAERAQAKQSAGAEQNLLAKGGTPDRVIGTRKVYPSLACSPIIEMIDGEEYVEAVYAFAGPHALNDIRLADGLIANAQDVEFETREGWPDDTDLSLVRRYGYMAAPNLELSSHRVKSTAQNQLEDQIIHDNSTPFFHSFSSRFTGQDEIWLHMSLPSGLTNISSLATVYRVPFRIRMRVQGETEWIDLPELHFAKSSVSPERLQVKLVWDATVPTSTVVPRSGFVAAYTQTPNMVIAPFTQGFTADSHFYAGSGNHVLFEGGQAASGVRNLFLQEDTATFYLDSATFPKDIYEFEIVRGFASNNASWNNVNYTISGVIYNVYSYSGTSPAIIPQSKQDINDKLALSRVVTVKNALPVVAGYGAYIAVRAKNRSIESLSVLASAFVRDWNGSEWASWTTTSNPAPHYVDALVGLNNPTPYKRVQMDNDGLVAWRQTCIDNGYTCDAIVKSGNYQETLELLASCGYARPYNSDIVGVIQDKDRSGEAPVRVFSPRNINGFSIEKGFARIPDGFRVVYPDQTNQYRPKEEIVYREGREGGELLEKIEYEGFVSNSAAVARARFDLLQVQKRSTFYRFNVPATGMILRRGDLIGLSHDAMVSQQSYGRLVGVHRNESGLVYRVDLDAPIQAVNNPEYLSVNDILNVDDVLQLGLRTTMAIKRKLQAGEEAAGLQYTTPKAIVPASEKVKSVNFVEPFDDDGIYAGALFYAGPSEKEYRRLLILDMAVSGLGESIALTAVDEAPEIWN